MTIAVRGLAPLLLIFDMPTSIAFYCDILGFELVSRSPGFGWALLELDGSQLMLNTAYDDGERPQSPDPARVAGHADTTIYFGAPDVDAVYAHLRARGVAVQEPSITSYGFKALFLKDPDGFELCFHWRHPSAES
jgi:catechol 2,3-dioxygenase-like lactoylglutathione lyase family enzyme